MKLYSIPSELLAIKSIAQRGTKRAVKVSSYLLAKLDESYFHYAPCKAAYKRIVALAAKRGVVMNYSELVEDLALEEEFRDILSNYKKKKPIDNKEDCLSLLNRLNECRRARSLYSMAKDVIDTLKKDKVDIDDLLDKSSDKLTEARVGEIEEDKIYVFGKGGNAMDLVDESLNVQGQRLYLTGIKEFDEKTGGFPTEGVVMLIATTGGGKSIMRNTLSANMYKLNKIDVVSFSFEMDKIQEVHRLESSLTGIPYWKFHRGCLSKEDRKKVKQVMREFYEFGDKNGCRHGTTSPTREMSMDDIFMSIRPYGYKVVFVDYVSLLKDTASKDEWKVLRDLSRTAKVYSRNTKSLIVLLAQLDAKTDDVRYAKGMIENADVAWKWNYSDPKDREAGIINVRQMKVRNSKQYDIELLDEFEFMRFGNPDNAGCPAADDEDADQEANTSSKKKKGDHNAGKLSKKGKSSPLDEDAVLTEDDFTDTKVS
jgi:replicative DNA helicase